MIETDFNDYFGEEGFPLGRALSGPPARCAWRISREPRLMYEPFKLLRQRRLISLGNAGSETDVVQTSLIVIQTEQQGPHMF